VGAERLITDRREVIRRLERRIRQQQLLSEFYLAAAPLVDQQPESATLIEALTGLARQTFSKLDEKEEWAKEAKYRVTGTLQSFTTLRREFVVLSGVTVQAVSSHNPVRLGLIGAVLGLMVLGGLTILRAGTRVDGREGSEGAART